jgi:hypothetical protein
MRTCAKRSPRRTIRTPALYSMLAATLVTNGSNGAMMRPAFKYGALYDRITAPLSTTLNAVAASGIII